MDSGGGHKTPRSEKCIPSNGSSQSKNVFALVSQAQFPQGDVKKADTFAYSGLSYGKRTLPLENL